MTSEYTLVIIVTFVGFVALAALLLVPVWRFLRRQEEESRRWTDDALRGYAESRTNGEAVQDDDAIPDEEVR